ncbi:hypothetical protein BRLA_c031200 [Brevibacillus laterosporus LMG 15441]|uniref:Uncharacterized protein n=1 Tax=Brevibacillus laterosporus LMG 15441 TaxID=1042163 RepID=A0A075R4G3_BRELA|nr:hypothetical protein BRLA_c031200 [Brevibacillus laterosporus LMG 15441]
MFDFDSLINLLLSTAIKVCINHLKAYWSKKSKTNKAKPKKIKSRNRKK